LASGRGRGGVGGGFSGECERVEKWDGINFGIDGRSNWAIGVGGELACRIVGLILSFFPTDSKRKGVNGKRNGTTPLLLLRERSEATKQKGTLVRAPWDLKGEVGKQGWRRRRSKDLMFEYPPRSLGTLFHQREKNGRKRTRRPFNAVYGDT